MKGSRKICIAGLVAVATLCPTTDASARRHADGFCRHASAVERCMIPARSRPKPPFVLQAPATCLRNALVYARATPAAGARRITVELDGVAIARSTRGRPAFAAAGVECASLSSGDHEVKATLIRRDGTRTELTRTLTRPAGGAPDDDLFGDLDVLARGR